MGTEMTRDLGEAVFNYTADPSPINKESSFQGKFIIFGRNLFFSINT